MVSWNRFSKIYGKQRNKNVSRETFCMGKHDFILDLKAVKCYTTRQEIQRLLMKGHIEWEEL